MPWQLASQVQRGPLLQYSPLRPSSSFLKSTRYCMMNHTGSDSIRFHQIPSEVVGMVRTPQQVTAKHAPRGPRSLVLQAQKPQELKAVRRRTRTSPQHSPTEAPIHTYSMHSTVVFLLLPIQDKNERETQQPPCHLTGAPLLIITLQAKGTQRKTD